jgi:hypothetical protein
MATEGEIPVAELQVRSLPELGSKPKKVRATLGGMMASILAAHRRLIAAISEVCKSFSELEIALELIVSEDEYEDGDGWSPPSMMLLRAALLLPAASLAPTGALRPSGTGAMVTAFPLEVACTDVCGVGAGTPVFTDAPSDDGRALAGKRADLVASRRLGNKVGGRTYSAMISRRNLWSQQDLKSLTTDEPGE